MYNPLPMLNLITVGSRLSIDKALQNRLDPREMYKLLWLVVAEHDERLTLWQEKGDLEAVEKALRFVKPGRPAATPLWGASVSIRHTTLLSTTKAVPDHISLETDLTIPAATAEANGVLPYRYTAVNPLPVSPIGGDQRKAMVRGYGTAAIGVEPEDRERTIGGDVMGVLPPQHIAWVGESYKGESDAVFFNATLEGLASYMGVPEAEVVTEIGKDYPAWQGIISEKGDFVTGKGSLLYVSAETRCRPWLQTITVPNLLPEFCVVNQVGQPTLVVPVVFRLFITPRAPVADVPMTAAIDSVVRVATGPLEGT